MNKEFKKTFFVCLLAVLLVVSNIVGAKYTNFLDVTIGVDFVTFPFTFLCTLLILNYGGKRDAYRGILVASVIQLLITISYAFIVSLGSQTLMPDKSMYVDVLFKVDETKVLASVLAFILSHCSLIYLYTNFKEIGKELYGLVVGLLGAMILNSIVFLVITLNGYEPIFIINILLSNIIVSVLMVVIITILFYILKENEEKVVAIKKIEKKETKDLSAEDLVVEKKNVVKPKTTAKKTSTKKTEVKKAETKKETVKKPVTRTTTVKKKTTTKTTKKQK